jgi:outer membrane receptor protein involved in Fe transport
MKNNFIRTVKMAAYYSLMGLILQGILVTFLFASPAEGQNLRDVKVSINAVNITLQQALQIIEKKTNFKFDYHKEDIPLDQKATVIVDEESLYNILEVFAKDYGLTFNRINDQIVVKKNVGQTENLVTANETGTIKGKVTDAATKEPLPGASVSLRGTTRGTFTDDKGNFEIENIKPGKYTVAASYVGYSTTTKTIQVESDKTTEVNFQLGQNVVNLDEVTVTGTMGERSVRESANPISVLTTKEIESRNLTYIGDALITLPGISNIAASDGMTSYGRIGGTGTYMFNIRGTISGTATSPSAKFIIDGVETVSYSDISYLDPNQIEKIEVSKGPMASTLYGAGASTGIIQIFTKKGNGSTHFELKTMFTTREDKYTYSNPMTYQVSLGVNGGKTDFGYNLSSNYSLYPISRYVLNNGIDEKDIRFNGNVYGNLNNIKVKLGFNYAQSENGTYSSPTSYYVALNEGWANADKLNTSTTVNDCNSKATNQRIDLNVKHIITDNLYQNLTAGTSSNESETVYITPTTTTSGTYYTYFKSQSSKQSVKYFINWAQPVFTDYSVDVTGGIDIRREKFSTVYDYYSKLYNEISISRSISTVAQGTQNVGTSYTTGLFAEGVWGYKNSLFLTTGFRIEADKSYGDHKNWYPMSRFGLTYVYPLGDFTFKPRVSYGKATESTSTAYKMDRIVTSGSYTYIYQGNQDIKPETQSGYEAGLDIFFTDKYSLSLTYFYQEVRDKVQSSYTQPDAYTYIYTYLNAACISNKGFEISAKGFFNPFTVEMNYSYIDSRYGSGYNVSASYSAYWYDGGRVILLPSTNIFARLSYRLPECISICSKRGDISFEASYKGHWLTKNYYDYYKSYCETGKYNSSYIEYYQDDPGYILFGMNLTYPVMNNLLLYANVKNLLNDQTVDFSFNSRSGRMIAFGFRLTY